MSDSSLPLFRRVLSPLEDAFVAFHEANPHVLDLVVREARHLRDRSGLDHGSIGMVWEHLRWLYAVRTERADDDFTLNDHHRAFYARLAMHVAPDLAGFFETRVQHGTSFDPALVVDRRAS